MYRPDSTETPSGGILNQNNKLLNLLSFDHCESEEDVYNKAFHIATELMQNWKIVAPSGERRFWGLEFYIHIENVFEDDAVHLREEQLKGGHFYIHTKSKSGWTPPIFNRHGVDIRQRNFSSVKLSKDWFCKWRRAPRSPQCGRFQ